jgi:hypothetical protein
MKVFIFQKLTKYAFIFRIKTEKLVFLIEKHESMQRSEINWIEKAGGDCSNAYDISRIKYQSNQIIFQ